MVNNLRHIANILMSGMLLIFLIVAWNSRSANAYDPLKMYNTAGQIMRSGKVWMDTIPLSSGNGQSIDISSAGFTKVCSIDIVTLDNTGTASSVPIAAVKSYTTSAVVVNTLSQNTSLVSVLGFSVLQGVPMLFTSTTTGIYLVVTVIGY